MGEPSGPRYLLSVTTKLTKKRRPSWVIDFYALAPAVFRAGLFFARAGLLAAAASPSVATFAIFIGRSATCTVRCAVRLTTRYARPIGAGRTRLADGPWLAYAAEM